MSDEKNVMGELLDNLINCPSCERPWNTDVHDSCQCGAVLSELIQQAPEINEAYVKEKVEEMATSCGFVSQLELDNARDFIRQIISEARGLQVPVVKIKAVPVKPDGNEKFPYECCEKCDRLIKQFACKGVPNAIECLYLLSKMKIKKKGGD